MTSYTTRAQLVGFAVLLVGSTTAHVYGHHGTAVSYDHDKEVTVTGKVTEFWWRNPHSALFIDVTNEKGEHVIWGLELGSPATLLRAGWMRRTFNPGDTVSIVVNPSRAGTPIGVCDSPCRVTVNGKVLSRSEQ
ncbi:MAG: hypothetical protein HY655_01955 [Acidobacteria bacterium]|nr:hypothetical protein [Acidobacteriota bacterium]